MTPVLFKNRKFDTGVGFVDLTASYDTINIKILLETIYSTKEYFMWSSSEAKRWTCLFHLNNRQATEELQIVGNSVRLKHCLNPAYLMFTLDYTLTYRNHRRNQSQN